MSDPGATPTPDITQATRGHLEQAWGAEYGKHLNAAMSTFERHAEPGQHFDQIMTNPAIAYRLLAKMGASSAGHAAPDNEASIKALLVTEAAGNPKHPDHKATRARIDGFYNRQYGNQEVIR